MSVRVVQGPFRVFRRNQTKGHQLKKVKTWNHAQMVRYTIFLQDYLATPDLNSNTKMGRREFEEMSKILKSRNSNQCRIFHSKMLQIKQNLKDIFTYFSSNIKDYSTLYQKHHCDKKEEGKRPNMVQSIIFYEDQDDDFKEWQARVNFQQRIVPDRQQGDNIMREAEEESKSLVVPKLDWFEQFDDYMNKLNGQWLDDI